MGGFGGLRLADYDATPDRVLVESYFAPRDEEHNLIPLRQRLRLARGESSGSPQRAGQELPPREELRIPEEAWQINPMLSNTPFGQAWVLMFFQVWRRRQREGVLDEAGQPITDEYILNRFRKAASQRGGHG